MSQFDLYYQQGLLLLKQGDYQGAIAAFSHAIELNSDCADAYYFRGEAQSELGNYSEALADFSSAIALNPQKAYLYCLRGWTKEELKDYQGPILDFDRAIALNFQNANVYISRGYAHRVLGNFNKAIADYTSAIAIDPENWHGYSHRGYALQAAGEFPGAIEDFTALIRLDPNNASYYQERGCCYLELKNYLRAIADFDQAIKLDPLSSQSYFHRGIVNSRLDNKAKAIENYTAAIRFNPQYLEAYVNRGNIYATMGQYQLAIKDYTKAIKIDSSLVAIYQNRGTAYAESHDSQSAIADWQQSIKLLQDRNDIYANTITAVLSNLIKTELAKNRSILSKEDLSSSWLKRIGKKWGIKQKLGNFFNDDLSSVGKLTLIYRPEYAKNETIHNPSVADLERVIDELWQEAQYIIQGETDNRFTGHFILEDKETNDYIQGLWDLYFQPPGGFQLERACQGERFWLPLPQTESEAKQVILLWVEDRQACAALNWQPIGETEPMSLTHSSRREFKVIHLLKQYEAGERNFRKEDLSNANLFGIDLQGINLSQACLINADLREANLTRANLTDADLSDACLMTADLRGANLNGAKLEGAIYNEDTEFPSGFDPEAAGMEFASLVEDEEELEQSNNTIESPENSRYLEKTEEILRIISQLASYQTLWLDTEIADWYTSHPRLSLIQVLADPADLTGNSTYIFDVLERPELVTERISNRICLPNYGK
jgi:tetratricopeptide (TPR) repeat protein